MVYFWDVIKLIREWRKNGLTIHRCQRYCWRARLPWDAHVRFSIPWSLPLHGDVTRCWRTQELEKWLPLQRHFALAQPALPSWHQRSCLTDQREHLAGPWCETLHIRPISNWRYWNRGPPFYFLIWYPAKRSVSENCSTRCTFSTVSFSQLSLLDKATLLPY